MSSFSGLNGVDERPRWRRNIRLYPLFYFCHDLQFWMPIWIIFATEDVGLTFAQLGAIGPAFYVIMSFGQPPAGAIADRFGRVRTMRVSVAIFLIFTIWFALTNSFWMAGVAWALWGLANVLITGSDSAFLHDSLQALGRERDFERLAGRAFAVRSVAMVLATIAGGVIAGLIGGQATVLTGTIGIALALLITLGFREPPRHEQRSGQAGPSYLELLKQTLRLAGRTPTIRYSLIFSALLIAALVPEFYLLQPFLREQGLEVGWVFSTLQAPARIATVFAAVLAYWLAVRFGVVRTLASMPFWVVLVYVGIAWLDHLGAIALFVILGLARGAQMPLMEGYLNRRVPSHLRATALSLNHMGWALIMLPFLPVFGSVVDAYPLPTVFLGLAVFYGPLLLIFMILWVRADRREGSGGLRLPPAVPALLREVQWKRQHRSEELPRPTHLD
ncbi:MAG: MFS transporter [Chloroflexota bacterium]|nr:MFS transporter [Chloroflexota bacterium]MDE2894976.1 MFS transporter [Chloroflexota bacterium]